MTEMSSIAVKRGYDAERLVSPRWLNTVIVSLPLLLKLPVKCYYP